jgi:hypothetical protein
MDENPYKTPDERDVGYLSQTSYAGWRHHLALLLMSIPLAFGIVFLAVWIAREFLAG